MGKRKNDSLKRRAGTRDYRSVCWVSAEGRTEKDYFSMSAFRRSEMSVRYPQDIHPGRRNPAQVLKRFQKAIRSEDFRKNDEAWILVDVDEWPDPEIKQLLQWAQGDERRHVAISNPKFELFLLLHFEDGKGCTTPQAVDTHLKRAWPQYDKRIAANQFDANVIAQAVSRAETKRQGCREAVPLPGMTDAHLLAKRLLAGK